MDALSFNMRVSPEPSLPDKRGLTESLPVTGDSSTTAPVDAKIADPSRKLSAADPKGGRELSRNVEDAVVDANRFFEQVSRELRFERSEDSGKMVVKVTNQKTGELIRQIPSKEMLEISRDLDNITGLLFKDSA